MGLKSRHRVGALDVDDRHTLYPALASNAAATSPLCPAPTIATSVLMDAVENSRPMHRCVASMLLINRNITLLFAYMQSCSQPAVFICDASKKRPSSLFTHVSSLLTSHLVPRFHSGNECLVLLRLLHCQRRLFWRQHTIHSIRRLDGGLQL